jgi:Holliday junction resolvase RusA-like endonuclease
MYLELKGRIPSKKNCKQIVRSKGRPMIISASDYLRWEKWAVLELKSQANKCPGKNRFDCCDVVIGITFPDKRKTDLSNKIEGVMDALVKAGIIKDDCWDVVRSINVFQVESENPGARIEIIDRIN